VVNVQITASRSANLPVVQPMKF